MVKRVDDWEPGSTVGAREGDSPDDRQCGSALREGRFPGKSFLQITQLIPAQGENAALQLMILIDDTLDTSVGNSLKDLKDFISAQPPSTVIAIGYMSNAGVNVVQNFTTDHDLAVKAVRLPRGSLSTMDSPYLSLISLVKGWTQQNVRRGLLMVTDGIDRLRGEQPQPSRMGPNFGTVYHSMPTIDRTLEFRDPGLLIMSGFAQPSDQESEESFGVRRPKRTIETGGNENV